MLSVLIPNRNYDCRRLAEALLHEAEERSLACEIIVGEDGSSPEWLALNAPLAENPRCRIISTPQNIGRAKIRNMLAQKAEGSRLLFIDSDAVVERDDFLTTYIEALKTNDVVCGGLYHADRLPAEDCTLRYRYEKQADKKRSAAERNKAPHDRFATFSFAIDRKLFLSIGFDEGITQYGYEDTLFGHELRRRGVPVLHIDNPLLHSGIENNAVYLQKVEKSIETLSFIKERLNETPLLRCFGRLQRMHLTGVTAAVWRLLRPLLRRNLLGRHPSLTLLNIHKLGLLCSLCK